MDALLNYWNGLTQTARENIVVGIVGGMAVATITGVLKLFGVSVVAGAKRLFRRTPPAVEGAQAAPEIQPRTHHELLIKVETPQPTSPTPQVERMLPEGATASPLIPRIPAVEFVPRRDKEGRDILSQLKEKLAPGSSSLIALWGPGGVGKTRLATEAAHALSEAFGRRAVWVSADGRPDFTLSTLLDEIAAQFNRTDLRQLAPEPKREQVRALISAAPTLVVLDNFETISHEEQARCRDFLARDTNCPALITTRTFLDSNVVHNVSIDAMSPDEADKFLGQLVAQAPDPQCFDDATRKHIIRTAAHIPLAIEWVVRQIFLTGEPQYVFDRLAHGDSDAARRVFDSSFNLPQVSDDARAALLALSLFTPDASRSALAEVAGFGDDVERLHKAVVPLGALRLLRMTDGGKRLLVEGLTRDLAGTHLSKHARADDFRRRFVAYFLRYAEMHRQRTPENFNFLEAERENVLGTPDIAFGLADWNSLIRITLTIIGVGTHGWLVVRGYWDEAIKLANQATEGAKAIDSKWHIGAFANALGMLYVERGDYSSAREHYELAVEIAIEINNEGGLAATLNQLAVLAHLHGKLDEARRLYRDGLEIQKRLGNENSLANILHNLAVVSSQQGNIDGARRLYGESLEIKKRLDDQLGIANTLHQLGRLAQAQGDVDEARRLYGESLEIEKGLGNQSGIASTLHNLGLIAEDDGDKSEAARLFREALDIFEKLRSPNADVARRCLERVEGGG